MNILQYFKHLISNISMQDDDHEEQKTISKNYKQQFKNLINEASYILESDDISSNDEHPIFIFIKQITDYITIHNSLNAYWHSDNDFHFLFGKCLEKNVSNNYVKSIITREVHDEDKKYYRNVTFHSETIMFDYSISPIIINPWHKRRTSDALINIATQNNKFDSIQYNHNISNYYCYPMGFIYCHNGNHSQYSAKLKNKGKTHIEQIDDWTYLYSYIIFDGEKFIYDFPNQSYTNYPIEYEIEQDLELYIGVLFEIGRLLIDKKNVFPKQIQDLITQNI